MREAGWKTKKEGKLGPVNIMLSISLSFSYLNCFRASEKHKRNLRLLFFSFFFFRCIFASVMTIHWLFSCFLSVSFLLSSLFSLLIVWEWKYVFLPTSFLFFPHYYSDRITISQKWPINILISSWLASCPSMCIDSHNITMSKSESKLMSKVTT